MQQLAPSCALDPRGDPHASRLGAGLDFARPDPPDQPVQAGVDLLRSVYAILVISRLLLLWLAFRKVTGSPGAALTGLLLLSALSFGRPPLLQPSLLAEVFFAVLVWVLSTPTLS